MKTIIRCNKFFRVGEIDKRMSGAFVEHLNQCLYGGIYEENHPLSDEMGFRKDVKELIKRFGVKLLRYPGGNFVSSYNWKDGIGPRESRPVRFDLAWGSRETNHVGIDEFIQYAFGVNTEVMLSVNLGTGTLKEAAELVEYCNIEKGTFYSDLRRKNGAEKSYQVKLWCIGNEMDGEWQIGKMEADTYAKTYNETAKAMRRVDPEIELVACGSCSNEPMHQTFGHWDRAVLEEAYDLIDYLSLHRYYGFDVTQNLAYPREETIGDVAWMVSDLDSMIRTIGSVIQYVKGIRRTEHNVYISFDELGILPKKARHSSGILYDSFTEYDAVLFGGLLCVLLNHSDLVKICCQALLTNENGMFSVFPEGDVLIQPIAFPFQNFADCTEGIVLLQKVECPKIETDHYGRMPCSASACVYFEEKKELRILIANFSLKEPLELEVFFEGFGQVHLEEWEELFSEDAREQNSESFPKKVYPSFKEIEDGTNIILKPHSWNVLKYLVLEQGEER